MKTKGYVLFLSAWSIFCATAASAQTSYYLSNDGNDANSGTGPETAWRTLARASSFSGYQPGDSILLRAGDVFRGTLMLNTDGIIVASYGNGAKPEIWGSETITGPWSLYSSNIYETPYTGRPSFIFIDGKLHLLARSPGNNKYHLITHAPSPTSIRDNALIGYAHDLKGAYISLRRDNWTVTTRTVTAFDNATGTITLSEPITFQGGIFEPGWGYILSNKLQFLDSPGEFFMDTANNQLYLWAYDHSVPTRVEASVHDFGIRTTSGGRRAISVSNIVFRYQAIAGVLLFDNSERISVSRCEFYHMPFAITNRQQRDNDGHCRPRASKEVNFSNNLLQNIYKAGVKLDNTTASVVENNTLNNICTIVNAAEWLNFPCGEFNESGAGINTVGNNSVVRGNSISVCGHYGIWVGNNGIVENNCIDSCCTLYSDCGAIYRYYDYNSQIYSNPPGGWKQVEIRNNTISNTIGNREGVKLMASPPSIYIDHRTGSPLLVNDKFIPDSLVIENNTIINGLSGIGSTGIARALIRKNIFYRCRGTSVNITTLDPYTYSQRLRKYHIYNNLFFTDSFHRQLSFYNSNPNNHNVDFCMADSNYYIALINRLIFYVRRAIVLGGSQSQDTVMDIDTWRDRGKDRNGVFHEPLYAHCNIIDTLTPGNLVRNPDFSQNNINGWSCHPTKQNSPVNYMSIARDTVAAFASYGLRATFKHTGITGIPSRVDCRLYDQKNNTNVVNLSPSSYYVVSFDIFSTAKKTLSLSIIRDEDSNAVFDSIDVEIKGNTVQHFYHIFKPTAAAVRAQLSFSGKFDNDYTFYLDNVNLFPVEAVCLDPAEKFPLFTNCTANSASISLLPNCYKDLYGNLVSGSLTLVPHSSVVLEWLPDTLCLTSGTATATVKTERLLIYPNPAQEFATVITDMESGFVRIYNASGREVSMEKFDEKSFRLYVGHLPAGMYFVELIDTSGSSRQMGKIIKME